MRDAYQLLFEKTFLDHPLFKNQQELVNALLADKNGPYHVEIDDKETYPKEQTRLKTLISQLLSPNVSRTIPDKLTEALENLISNKLNDQVSAHSITLEIIEDLRKKNQVIKSDSKGNTIQQLKGEFKTASYVAVITSNPLEIEAEETVNTFSIRQVFTEDFFNILKTELFFHKKFRFLFSTPASCSLFWKGLKEIISKFLRSHKNDSSFIKKVYTQVYPDSNYEEDLFLKNNSSYEQINDLADAFVHHLNKSDLVSIFHHDTPIFALPTIAINPAESSNSSVYIIMDSRSENPKLYRLSEGEIVLWRLFVWDKLKVQPYTGKKIAYQPTQLFNQDTSHQ